MTKIFIAKADFYQDIAKDMLESVLRKIKPYDYDIQSVPGTFELPSAINLAIKSNKYDAYIALGCVIRGETTHYDYVCGESARGLNDLSIKHNAPIGFGVITCENKEQAYVRADSAQKDVGGKAAMAAIAMLEIKNKLGL